MVKKVTPVPKSDEKKRINSKSAVLVKTSKAQIEQSKSITDDSKHAVDAARKLLNES